MKNCIMRSVIGAVAVLLCCITSITNAQNIELGIRAMPTFSSLNLKTVSGSSVKGEVNAGFGFGGVLGFALTKNVGIQAEVIYNSLSQENTEAGIERKVNLRYINIPLLLCLNTPRMNAVSVNVVAGPQLGINAGSSIRTSGGDGVNTAQGVVSVRQNDFGLAYGAGADFALNSSRLLRLSVGFRGVLGIVNISDNSETLSGDSFFILDQTHIKSYSGYIGLSILI